MIVRWPVALLVMLTTVLVQASGFDQVALPANSRLDLPLLLLVGIGLVGSANTAALAGFVLGLMVDLFQFGPFGIHALVYCLAAWTLVNARVRILEAGASFRTIQGAGAVVVVTALTWFVGGVFGQDPPPFDQWLPRLGWSAIFGAILVHLAARLAGRMLVDVASAASSEPARVR